MARALRVEYPGAVYHVTSRGNRRQRIFNDDGDRHHFLELLGELTRRYGWIVSVYVLMTNHFHLVIETPAPNLAAGMKWLNGTYASWYNRRHGKVGHLFGERYKAIHVQSEEYMQRLARYVVLNPVRARMVATPGEYRWSSYRATAGLEDCPDWLRVGGLEPYFGEASSWRGNYTTYVAEGIDVADPIWRGLRRRVFLGTEQWLRSIRQKIDVAWRHVDIPHDQRAAGRPSMGAIVNAVADAMNLRPREIRRGSGGLARKVAAWLGVYEGRRRLRVIAKTLHLKSCSRITQLAAECDGLLRSDRKLAAVVSALRLSLA